MRTAPVGGHGLFDPEGTRRGVHSCQAARATVRPEGTRRGVRACQAAGATVRPEGARRGVHPTVRQGVWGVVCCRVGGSSVGTVARRG